MYKRRTHTQSVLHRISSDPQFDGVLNNTVNTGSPQFDGVLNNIVRIKIRYYRQLYVDRPDPIVFLSVVLSTSGHVYDDFVRLFFLYVYREGNLVVFYLENYLRNLNSFVSFEMYTWRILRTL